MNSPKGKPVKESQTVIPETAEEKTPDYLSVLIWAQRASASAGESLLA